MATKAAGNIELMFPAAGLHICVLHVLSCLNTGTL